ncbi:MAG: DNA cytosine methyltransferase [Hyphomicrobiales bacterium]|nr:DNA cytosine methyltransferase [Hyphomicrobiales bacterium]
MPAYYNEVDPYAAAWLKNLIAAGHLPAGDVDDRDIRDVCAADLRGYGQCHFFAGIGGWPYALRLAGWPDERPVWTGSCPCQPFSAAGKGAGFADERHLWPDWYWLIAEHGAPATIFGEQVASPLGREWLAGVRADLEALGYAVGAADLCAAGVGAPHIRQRLWWVADADSRQRDRIAGGEGGERNGQAAGWQQGDGEPECGREVGGVVDPTGARHDRAVKGPEGNSRNEARLRLSGAGCGQDRHEFSGPSDGFWRDADRLLCRDGKWRPVEPGTFPLLDGAAFKLGSGSALEGKSRVGMLRAYGNAIVPQLAAEFIAAFIEATGLL